jgi:sugar phosphate isomerase/epimerase
MERPLIAFSTLACPEWTPDEVVSRAAVLGYDGIEWRGGTEGHVSTSWPPGLRARLRRAMADAGVAPLAVTAYTSFVTPHVGVRASHRDDLIRHLDLAADLGAPPVRAFVGIIEDATPMTGLVDRACEALLPAADHAASIGVSIALEPHDDFVRAGDLALVLRAAVHPAIGAIWEIGNAWEVGEHPSEGGPILEPWIRYVQLKDGRGSGSSWRLTALGDGEVPLAPALALLAERGALPPLSVEWERAWHPELDPAEVALGPALATVRRLLAGVGVREHASSPPVVE